MAQCLTNEAQRQIYLLPYGHLCAATIKIINVTTEFVPSAAQALRAADISRYTSNLQLNLNATQSQKTAL
jgi:hypothetical protein